MSKTIRMLAIVSRAEFLPAMASFFIMGLSWGINPQLSFMELMIPAVLAFAVIMFSALVGLQVNTVFDHDLDCADDRKAGLVHALGILGRGRLKLLVIIESLFGLVFVFLLLLDQGKPALLFMWIVGISLAYAYSTPPLRLKSRSWLSLIALLLSICVLPLLFTFHTFSSELDHCFLLFLPGQALSAYSLILSSEIRDYFEDDASGIETMAVRIGLVKASFLSVMLLALGGVLTGTAFFLRLVIGHLRVLNIFLFTVAATNLFVLRKLVTLCFLSREYMSSRNRNTVVEEIRRSASHSPQWTILVSQTAVFMSLLLLVGKFLL